MLEEPHRLASYCPALPPPKTRNTGIPFSSGQVTRHIFLDRFAVTIHSCLGEPMF